MTVLLILLTGQFMANVDTSVVNVAAPAIHNDLQTSASGLQLVVSGFVLTSASLLIVGARLGARFGHERVFTVGVATFTGASLLCGLAPTTLVLILARLLQGVGAAVMVPQVLTGIQRAYEGVLVWANLFGSSW